MAYRLYQRIRCGLTRSPRVNALSVDNNGSARSKNGSDCWRMGVRVIGWGLVLIVTQLIFEFVLRELPIWRFVPKYTYNWKPPGVLYFGLLVVLVGHSCWHLRMPIVNA